MEYNRFYLSLETVSNYNPALHRGAIVHQPGP
jgi:hypothetical protein